ncbi:DUF1800 domain-containing protein [Aquabacterium lacunae]|uniref:DUF1800 domain-containing protein n=1 Tax=Aquabacterium lacunae TaxID=2528630 RepID=A0A4Q9H5V6_9BURK|nr:DUF1800 domain-containing protein [Aquabacterium lacunae]TBO34274.1 DUF1800 domain-containing protein [Aquabacterium lacunae]
MAVNFRRTWMACAALALSLTLSGCFEPAEPSTPPTTDTAARFLNMTTFGATQADVDKLVALGYEGWLNEQFAATPIDTHYGYADRGGPPDCAVCPAEAIGGVIDSFWYQAIKSPDQLRQRVALAWLELFVVSAATDSAIELEPYAMAAYLDLLSRNAFANYRQVLEAVTLSPAMGHYLSHMQNDKEDPATGRLPDENYAREVMQLFTIGKWMLNTDGTRMTDGNGNPIPTYSQADVMGLAKVLTGWSWGGPDTSEERWVGGPINFAMARSWELPMQPYPQHHSTSEAQIVGGVTIPANTSAPDSLKIALDTLFNHPNAGPFIATHFIKRLTTSNPSPEYVARVAAVFNANKANERGNMQSVIRAVLFDPEVWDGRHLTSPTWGKPREPIVKAAQLVRGLSCRSSSGMYPLGTLQATNYDLGQAPLMSNSVFNFFLPDHQPQGELSNLNLSAPEFQIANDNTTIGHLNYMWSLLGFGLTTNQNSLVCDYSAFTPLASQPDALIDALVNRFVGAPISAQGRQTIKDGITSIADNGTVAARENRVKTALLLLASTPEFNVQR